ncbi:glycoside hydrolase family 2 TIM barrel-domain containing protein [Aurantiacibacter gilvus]|uniref:Glycoside hydrolase family 2 TIM barrel-domain containing protein n=1 Tax=Aurantiacibacter gilvus TaxID=3139141 RepID=A0ABU9IFG6_9SPHN
MKKILLIAAASLIYGCQSLPSTVPPPSMQTVSSPRESIEFADGWRFVRDDTLTGVELPTFDDSGWERVSVPHSWNNVGHYLPNPETHINREENINDRLGIGWYRLDFATPQIGLDERAWLEFDAASRVADVWLNGVHLGTHRGGFTRFRFDATDALNTGQPNVLVVKVDNRQPNVSGTVPETLPLAGDFFIHGGLYRPVSLLVTSSVHLDLADMGSSGVYAITEAIGADASTVQVRARVRNDEQEAKDVLVTSALIDAQGATAASSQSRINVAPGSVAEPVQSLEVENARLWQGVTDPYLYTLRVTVSAPSGQVLDSVEQQFGIRQFAIDPDTGFSLNGEPYELRGVGFHQDFEGQGWAVSAEDTARSVDIIREMGANTIRLAHYPHGQTVHELANRYGLILWDEIPLVNMWSYNSGQVDPSPEMRENIEQQLREMIRQNYNHPSVITWGLANELDMGSTDALPLLATLNEIAHNEDPTRPTSQAVCCEDIYPGKPVFAPGADLGGANRYYGWYYGTVGQLGEHLDMLRDKRPMQPLAVTEYGAGGAVTIHTDNPLGGPIDRSGPVQPEEYLSYYHEESWRQLAEREYLWGTWLWNMFDFATTTRREGDSVNINTKGLVTYDREIRKDAYYFYQANWSDEPTVHINSRRYTDRAYSVTDVRVYSNREETSLSLNGVSLGTKDDCQQNTCVWEDVRLRPGVNTIIATGSDGTEDRIEWNLAPQSANAFRIDSGTLVAAPVEGVRYGSDTFFTGGTAANMSTRVGRGPVQPAVIEDTTEPVLLSTYRRGTFGYRVPTGNGRYTVTLHFVEPNQDAGERIFNVMANDQLVLSRLDVAAIAGGRLKAISRDFEVLAEDGFVDLQFQPVSGEPIVSAVEITPVDD